jgi:5-methylcytosine-specific restriction endonuclease McrA
MGVDFGAATRGRRAASLKLQFEHPEDRLFFEHLPCWNGESLAKYADLFDFRPGRVKRAEFQLNRRELLSQLVQRYGHVCQIRFPAICDDPSGMEVDHLIPLSSNKLNKMLRRAVAPYGRKVPPQSFGSNDLKNLVIACRKCNGHKKHTFISRTEFRRILVTKGM